MESLIENNSIITREIHGEFLKKTKKIWYSALMIILGLILIGLSSKLLYENYQNIRGFDIKYGLFALTFLLLGVFCLIWPAIFYKILGKKAYERDRFLNNNEELSIYTKFFEDKVEITQTNGGKLTLEYKDIKKVYTSKNLYIIEFKKRVAVIVRKDSFIKGSLEELVNLIKKIRNK